MRLKHTGPFTFLAVVAFATGVHAQSPRSGYTGFMGFGASSVQTSALDEMLAATGLPKFGSGGAAVSLGAYRLLRSGLIVGGEWHYVSLGDEQHSGRDAGLGGGYATLGIAYGLRPSPRTRIYPRLGLGIGGMGLWRENPAPPRVAFDDWLTTPAGDSRYSTLSQASMVMDLGAGAELELRRNARGPVIGLRAGYVATPFDQGWTFEGAPVTGAPSATVAGPYVRMMLGWRRERSH